MEPQHSNLVILEDNQDLSYQTTEPPRNPHWYDTIAYISNPDQFCRNNLVKYGPIFKTSVFGGTTVFLGSSDAIQMAFNGDLQYTEIGLPSTTMEMFGPYSLFQRPDLHRMRKSALKPGFTGQMLSNYLTTMNQIIAKHLQNWQSNKAIYLFPAVEEVCFDVLVPILLGIELDNNSLTGLPISSKNELKRLYKTFFDGFYGLIPWRSRLTTFGRGLQARSRLIEFMRTIIKQKKANPELTEKSTSNFLAMMLTKQAEDPDSIFSDDLIENQCLLQLWASHYEVSGLVSSWIYQLGMYPEMLKKLRLEQATVLGDEIQDTEISLDHLKQMTFLDATIKETLRILPPSSTANRRLTKSVVLNDMLYKKGWVLIAEPRIAHKIDSYFTQPEKFDPERFLPERGEGKLYEFIPFGGGVHGCLGAQLALTMAKIFIIRLLNLFDWELTGKAKFVQFPLKKINNQYQIKLFKYSSNNTNYS